LRRSVGGGAASTEQPSLPDSESVTGALARLVFVRSPELEEALRTLVRLLGLSYVDTSRVYGVVSKGSRSTAYARIWGLPSPFVRLGLCEPMYVVELVYENVAGLTCSRLLEVLVHELLHIPRSFSGGLRSHGEWSRKSKIRELVQGLPPVERRRLCSLVRDALRGASSNGQGMGSPRA